MMNRLEGEIAIITGGASGMGESHARRFIAEGARVVVTDRDQSRGSALQEELGENMLFIQQDVADPAGWPTVVADCAAHFAPPSILVNNAGIVLKKSIEDTSYDEYMRMITVNQTSVFLGMKAVIPCMKKAGHGSIINISSVCGLIGNPGQVAYTASKFAIRGMSKVAAVELGPYGIRVNSIHPGAVQTPIQQHVSGTAEFVQKLPIKRLAESDEVSSLVLFLASRESAYCTGSEFVIDGGWTAQ